MRCKYSMPFTLRVWHWCCVWFMGVLIQTTFCCLLASWVCVCMRRTAESISIYGHIQKNLYQFLISVIIGHGPSNTFIAQLNFCCIRIYIYIAQTHVCVKQCFLSIDTRLSPGRLCALFIYYLLLGWAHADQTIFGTLSSTMYLILCVTTFCQRISSAYFFALYLMMNSIINYSSHRQE